MWFNFACHIWIILIEFTNNYIRVHTYIEKTYICVFVLHFNLTYCKYSENFYIESTNVFLICLLIIKVYLQTINFRQELYIFAEKTTVYYCYNKNEQRILHCKVLHIVLCDFIRNTVLHNALSIFKMILQLSSSLFDSYTKPRI